MLSDSVGRRPVRFVARVYCIGIIRFVDVPPEAGRAFSGRHVPVRGTCNGATLVGTLVPRGQGGYRLSFNAAVGREGGGGRFARAATGAGPPAEGPARFRRKIDEADDPDAVNPGDKTNRATARAVAQHPVVT